MSLCPSGRQGTPKNVIQRIGGSENSLMIWFRMFVFPASFLPNNTRTGAREGRVDASEATRWRVGLQGMGTRKSEFAYPHRR